MRTAAVILRSTVVGFTLIDSLKIAPCHSQLFKASKLLLTEICGHNFERFPFLSTLEAKAAGYVLTTTKEFVMITVEVLTASVVMADNRVQVNDSFLQIRGTSHTRKTWNCSHNYTSNRYLPFPEGRLEILPVARSSTKPMLCGRPQEA